MSDINYDNGKIRIHIPPYDIVRDLLELYSGRAVEDLVVLFYGLY